MKRNLFILMVAISAVAAWYGYHEYNRGAKDLAAQAADVSITANELVTAFKTDEAHATQRYNNKAVAVRGTVIGVEQSEKGLYTLYLGDSAALENVSGEMAEAHNQSAATVKVGDVVTLKGVCTGFVSDVVLVRCVLVP